MRYTVLLARPVTINACNSPHSFVSQTGGQYMLAPPFWDRAGWLVTCQTAVLYAMIGITLIAFWNWSQGWHLNYQEMTLRHKGEQEFLNFFQSYRQGKILNRAGHFCVQKAFHCIFRTTPAHWTHIGCLAHRMYQSAMNRRYSSQSPFLFQAPAGHRFEQLQCPLCNTTLQQFIIMHGA